MRHKRGRQPNYEKKKTPYRMAGTGDERETLFAQLVAVLGYPIGKAFSIAFPDSKATANSITPMASRLLREQQIQAYIYRLYRYHAGGGLCTFQESAIKE